MNYETPDRLNSLDSNRKVLHQLKESRQKMMEPLLKVFADEMKIDLYRLITASNENTEIKIATERMIHLLHDEQLDEKKLMTFSESLGAFLLREKKLISNNAALKEAINNVLTSYLNSLKKFGNAQVIKVTYEALNPYFSN